MNWQQPARFRRVCPLLTQTPQGWRCGVNAESARPFWGRACLYAGVLGLGLYLAGTLALYGILRTARYETSYLSVVWPPRWGKLRAAQEKVYATRAQHAILAGNFQEAILSLDMVVRLNPHNYPAGLALAGLSQAAGQPYYADQVYERLMRDMPEQRRQTAQIWFHGLLARAAYARIEELATTMLNEDPAERAAWLNALLFSCRKTGNHAALGTVVMQNPDLPEWCIELIGIEQLLLRNQLESALPRLTRIYRHPASAYIPYYQIDRLLRHGQADRANALLRAYRSQLQPDEAGFLRLRAYQAKGWATLMSDEFDDLLRFDLAPRLIAEFCAYLVKHPEPARFARYYARFIAADLPVTATTMPLYQATYLAASQAGDASGAGQITLRINQYTASNARALQGLGALLKDRPDDPRLGRILPLVQLPTEVIYAILDNQPAAALPGK